MGLTTNSISFKARVILESDKPAKVNRFKGKPISTATTTKTTNTTKNTFVTYLRKNFLYPKFNIKIKMPS